MTAGPVGGVVRTEKQIVAAFQTARATSADRAATAAGLGVDDGLAFRVLRRHEVLRDAGGERVYLDESAWEMLEAKRRRLAIIIPVIILLAGAVLWAVYR